MYLNKKYENQNKGLPTRFVINQSGGFGLVGGKAKVDDNVIMLLAFIGWFRLFKHDYVINVYNFYQNTTAYLYQFKNILRLQVMDIGKRYVPFAKLYAVDVPVQYNERKETSINIQFKYNLSEVEEYQTIKKIIL